MRAWKAEGTSARFAFIPGFIDPRRLRPDAVCGQRIIELDVADDFSNVLCVYVREDLSRFCGGLLKQDGRVVRPSWLLVGRLVLDGL